MRSNLLVLSLVIAGSASWGWGLGCGGSTSVLGDAGAGADGSGSGSGGGGGSGSGSGSGSSSGSSSGAGSGGGSGSSSGSSGGGSGSSSGGGSTVCPTNQPTPGGTCPVVGMQCENGNDPNPDCNTIYDCGASGWSTPAPVLCVAGSCPSSYADVPQFQDCTPQGLDCAYPQGQCNCAETVPASGPGPKWQCATPMQGCPEPRPRIGSMCTVPGVDCDYGACTGGVNVECMQGSWQEQATACPVFVPRHM